jgi:UDP-N-acetylmuramyl-tripeptide synthetase
MLLKDILKGIDVRSLTTTSEVEVGRVVCDSRSVKAGDMFIAFKGYAADGSRFIKDALAKGAKIVLAEQDFDAPAGVVKVIVPDSRSALPAIAANFYRHPSKELKVIGVTGTNGKTTITYIIENILKCASCGAGVIGTINYRIKDKVIPSKNTTPGPLELQSMLADMIAGGVRFAVMEVSSHSLDQRRVEGVRFDAAIFTNVTADHLDYHKTQDNYLAAKAKLLEHLKDGGTAILNNDDPRIAALENPAKSKVITYGVKEISDVMCEELKISLDGSEFIVNAKGDSFRVSTKLIGEHNVSNILASVAAGIALGIEMKYIKMGVETAVFAPGRLEPVDAGAPFRIFVDYAHTEDALRNVLGLLRKTVSNRIITVFGCGGNRDRTKRPLMGRAACELSDYVVMTSDNPRHEEPLGIIEEIEAGIRGLFINYEAYIDRREAIARALKIASKDDIVLIAGKGHESYQVVGDEEIPFDDRLVAREILKDMLK